MGEGAAGYRALVVHLILVFMSSLLYEPGCAAFKATLIINVCQISITTPTQMLHIWSTRNAHIWCRLRRRPPWINRARRIVCGGQRASADWCETSNLENIQSIERWHTLNAYAHHIHHTHHLAVWWWPCKRLTSLFVWLCKYIWCDAIKISNAIMN